MLPNFATAKPYFAAVPTATAIGARNFLSVLRQFPPGWIGS